MHFLIGLREFHWFLQESYVCCNNFTLCNTVATHFSLKSRNNCTTYLFWFLCEAHCVLLTFCSIKWASLCMLCMDTIFFILQVAHSTNPLVLNIIDMQHAMWCSKCQMSHKYICSYAQDISILVFCTSLHAFNSSTKGLIVRVRENDCEHRQKAWVTDPYVSLSCFSTHLPTPNYCCSYSFW
jgi:hypothetical protein